MKQRENILSKNKINVKKVAVFLCEALLGLVLSRAGVGAFFPFGMAYASVSGVFGSAGAILGYLIGGEDVFRYTISVLVNCAARIALNKVLTINTEYKAFLFTLWSALVAGIAGVFVVDSSFADNCIFILGGLAGGAMAFILSISASALKGIKKLTPTIRFAFICVSVSAALTGLYSFGTLFVHAALTLTYYLLYCVCSRCGLYVSVTAAAIVSLFFFIVDTSLLPFCAALIIGTVFAGIIKSVGRFPVMPAFIASASLMTILSGGEIGIFTMLPDVLFAWLLYAVSPKAMVRKITDSFASGLRPTMGKGVMSKKKLKIPTEKNGICDSCKKRIICWVKEFSATADIFNKLKTGEKADFPEHFKSRCEKSGELIKKSLIDKPPIKRFIADSASLSLAKNGESICGDTCVSFVAEDGRQVFVIADGMGTGANAGQQSFRISALLKKLLGQGLDKNDALRLVNETLLRGFGETIMGLDIALFDETTGVCEFIKAGAAPSFILRNGEVYEVGAASLPVGILDDVSPGKSRCRLAVGDIFVMVSDGLISTDESRLRNILYASDARALDPVSLTGHIGDAAKKAGLTEKDDISVITVYVR